METCDVSRVSQSDSGGVGAFRSRLFNLSRRLSWSSDDAAGPSARGGASEGIPRSFSKMMITNTSCEASERRRERHKTHHTGETLSGVESAAGLQIEGDAHGRGKSDRASVTYRDGYTQHTCM